MITMQRYKDFITKTNFIPTFFKKIYVKLFNTIKFGIVIMFVYISIIQKYPLKT